MCKYRVLMSVKLMNGNTYYAFTDDTRNERGWLNVGVVSDQCVPSDINIRMERHARMGMPTAIKEVDNLSLLDLIRDTIKYYAS